jgi:hypothetical protein
LGDFKISSQTRPGTWVFRAPWARNWPGAVATSLKGLKPLELRLFGLWFGLSLKTVSLKTYILKKSSEVKKPAAFIHYWF